MFSRSKLWAVGLLFAVFLAGAAVGGATSTALGGRQRPVDGRRGGPPPGQRDRSHRSYADHLQDVLDLSAAQRTAVDSILHQGQTAMNSVWREARPRFDSLRQGISTQIMEILNETQQQQYDELLARSNRRGERERAPKDP